MSLSPRTTSQALDRAQAEWRSRSQNWTGMCQKFTRTVYGVGPGFATARAQFLGCDPEDRHIGGHPEDAPVGSILHFKGGSEGFGHAELAAPDFPDGSDGAWSNDLVKTGYIHKVHRNAPVTRWSHVYTGYCTAINDVDLRMPQKSHYAAIRKAINRLEVARENAKAQSDASDVTVLTAEINRLQKMYDTLRRHA